MQFYNINNTEVLHEHVIYEYPKEACGFVVENKYIPIENVANDPVNTFEITNEKFQEYESTLEGIIHSHTHKSYRYDGRVPSKLDMMLSEQLPEINLAIAHCTGYSVSKPLIYNKTIDFPLINRPYIPNVYDCYTLVRDYHQDKLPLMPRNEQWEEENPSLLLENLNKYSSKIGFNEAKIGDILIYRIGSNYPNHLAILYDENRILHHLAGRPSDLDDLTKWSRQLIDIRRCKK